MNARFRSWPAILIVLTALLSCNVFYSRPAQADPDVDINVFFGALAPYGTWVDHNVYGRAWYPRGVSRGWRPYTDGHWVYNFRHGWVWVSDWIWGWAPFHYGRWAWDNWYGWIWLPGRIWAPAWVVWRYGGGYAGWAPMPPNAIWRPGYGWNMHHFDYDRDLRRDDWVYVPERRLHDRHIRRHIIDPRHNERLFKKSRNFVNVSNDNDSIVNRGVPVKRVEKSSGRKVRPVTIRAVESMEDRKRGRSKNTLTVVRPKITAPGADDIRKEEELARKLSTQNEQRRSDQSRSQDKPSGRQKIQLPERLRKGAPAESAPGKEVGREALVPSRRPQPADRLVPPQERREKPADEPHGGWQEQRRRQTEQADRARQENARRQQLQEREEQQRQQQIQQQRQLESQRRQTEQAERARQENARRQQLQEREEQQRRQQLQQQRQIEIQRREAEQAERAREEALRRRQFQEREEQQRRQQLQQQQERFRHEQQRQQEFEQQQQLFRQRQREMQQQQMEIQRRQNEQVYRRQQQGGGMEQQRGRQQNPRQENRSGHPGYGR